MKKKIVELKNELARLRVSYDMGEYSNFLGKSPAKSSSKKVANSSEEAQEKVRSYVEDLAVLRENLLKIEFKNIELEEITRSKELQLEDL